MKQMKRNLFRKHGQTALLMLIDALLACLSLILALQVYYDMHPPEHLEQVWRAMPLLAAFTIAALYAMGLYKSLLRYASVDTLIQIAAGTLIGTGATYLVSLAVFTMMGNWNDLLYPLMLTTTTEMRTLPSGLAMFVGERVTQYGPSIAGSVISMMPLLLMYCFAQKYFIAGIAMSGMKD